MGTRIVLVSGSRHATTAHVELIAGTLGLLCAGGPGVLRTGGAPGLDTLAGQIVTPWGWDLDVVPAEWQRCVPDIAAELGGCPDWPHRKTRRDGTEFCPYAGPRRNQIMVDRGPRATDVQVFPAGDIETQSGTRDLWMRAIRAGLNVHHPAPLPIGGRHARR